MNSINTSSNSNRQICRTCLEQKNDLISLYSTDPNSGMQICEMILQFSQVQIYNKENAQLFLSICADCRYKLNIAFQFQQQCKNSEIRLQEFLRNDRCVSIDSVTLQEFFGPEEQELNSSFQPNMVLASDIENNLKSSDLLNMDIILNTEKSPRKIKKVKNRLKPIKGKTHLDDLLRSHKEKMKTENASKIQIFKQKRKRKTVSPTKTENKEQCFHCGKFFNKGYLETHFNACQVPKYKKYECNVCQKKFTQVSNLNLHMRIHTKEKPFACHECPKLFSTSSNLKVHLKIHTGIKDHICSLCNKAFKTSSELKSHEGTHSQIKNKICKICGKNFYKTSYLNVHMNNVHLGLKKFKCDSFNCNKIFSNSSNLIAHRRIHSGEKPFVCKKEGCSAKFNQSSSLVRHMKSHNKVGKIKLTPEKEQIPPKVPKKTPYIIPELLKETPNDVTISNVNPEPTFSHKIQNISNCQQENIQQQQPSYSIPQPQQSLLPEALNPMNLINNSSNSNYNPISTHSAPSFLPPLPHHDTTSSNLADHQMHHFSNFDNTYLPPALPNSFNFIMGGNFSFPKNSLNGEPTYIDY